MERIVLVLPAVCYRKHEFRGLCIYWLLFVVINSVSPMCRICETMRACSMWRMLRKWRSEKKKTVFFFPTKEHSLCKVLAQSSQNSVQPFQPVYSRILPSLRMLYDIPGKCLSVFSSVPLPCTVPHAFCFYPCQASGKHVR